MNLISTTAGGRAARRATFVAALAACAATCGIGAATAAADTVRYAYTTPGTYTLKIPAYATSVNVIANGASGTDGGSSSGGGSGGGTGGHGAQVNVPIDIGPGTYLTAGDTIAVTVGKAGGGGGAGGPGSGLGGAGGRGGGAAIVKDVSSHNGIYLAVAGGGGGGGGGGGAFGGYTGGDGGQGPGTGGNGLPGQGVGHGRGGSLPLPTCTAGFGTGGIGGSAGSATSGGGGGGGGDGLCAGVAGGGGGLGGGGGGGGSAGGSTFWGAVTDGTIGVDDTVGNASAVLVFTRTPVSPTISAGTSLSVPATIGTIDNIAIPVAATGFPAPTFSLTGAPSWLSIDPDTGDITGAVPDRLTGSFPFTITASNGVGTASQQFTLSVTSAPLVPTVPLRTNATVGAAFATSLKVTGGIPPYTFSVASGALPAGLTLSPSGRISGTPTTAGTRAVTVAVHDSAQPTAAATSYVLHFVVAAPTLTVTTTALAAGAVGTPYSQTLTAALGKAPYSWKVTSGLMPAGLTLNPTTGTIGGTPTSPGAVTLTVQATDASSPAMTATATLSIVVHPAVQAAVYVVNGGVSSLESFPLAANGNVAPTTNVTGAATGLNGTAAVVLDDTGRAYVASSNAEQIAIFDPGATGNVPPSAVIGGDQTQIALPYALALDSGGRLFVADYAANAVTAYAKGATGNVAPVVSIGGPHTGLSGPIALTFDQAGHLWVASLGTNALEEFAAGANGDATPIATIAGPTTGLRGPQGLVLDGAGNLLVANTYANSLTEYAPTANGDVAPLRTIFGASTGLAFPHGVDVDANGNIFVANENAGIVQFAAGASGAATPMTTIAGATTGLRGPWGLAVAPPLNVRTAHLAAGRVGHRYRAFLRANLGTTPYRWARVGGHLPPGLHLAANGRIAGRPLHRGVYRFTVRVRDASHPRMTATRRLVLRIRRG